MNQLRVSNLFNCFALSIGYLFFGLLSTLSAQSFHKIPKESKATDIFISEICQASGSGYNFVELYNPNDFSVDLSAGNYFLSRDNLTSISDVALAGTINAHSTYVCSTPYSHFIITWKWFLWEYGINPNQQDSDWAINSPTSFMLYKNGNSANGDLLDIYGELGVSHVGADWDYSGAHAVRKRNVSAPNTVWDSEEWVIVEGGTNQMTPGQHSTDLVFNPSSGSWNGRGNWSGMGYVPDASSNVEISGGKTISVDASSACNQLIIQQNAILSLSAGQALEVVESIDNQGDSDALILKAGSNGSSSLLHQNNGVSATVESYFNDIGTGEWYLISSPIANALAGIYMDQYLDYWDESNAQWVDILDENFLLLPGQGYSVQKEISHLVNYSGTLNNGDITISGLTKTTAGSYFSAGWNLVGNPYPSVLDVSKLNFGNYIVAAASVWPHGSTGAYLNWSQGSGGDSEARYIQPGQGFMIQLVSTNQSLTFTNAARTHQRLGSFDKSRTDHLDSQSLKISLTDQDGRSDHTYLKFEEEATNSFDPYYDVHKLFGANNFPQIYSYIDMDNEEKASIQALPFPNEGELIHLGYQIGVSGNFMLQIEGMSQMDADREIYLIDHLKDEIFDLKQDSVFSLNIQLNDPPQRFDLLFDMSTPTNSLNQNNAHVFFMKDQLIIEQQNVEEPFNELVIYNLMGQSIKTYSINSNHEIFPVDLPSSFYVIQLKNRHQSYSQKLFKN